MKGTYGDENGELSAAVHAIRVFFVAFDSNDGRHPEKVTLPYTRADVDRLLVAFISDDSPDAPVSVWNFKHERLVLMVHESKKDEQTEQLRAELIAKIAATEGANGTFHRGDTDNAK